MSSWDCWTIFMCVDLNSSEKYQKIASQEVYKEATWKRCRSQTQGPLFAATPTLWGSSRGAFQQLILCPIADCRSSGFFHTPTWELSMMCVFALYPRSRVYLHFWLITIIWNSISILFTSYSFLCDRNIWTKVLEWKSINKRLVFEFLPKFCTKSNLNKKYCQFCSNF